jgi:hypothetical protein
MSRSQSMLRNVRLMATELHCEDDVDANKFLPELQARRVLLMPSG